MATTSSQKVKNLHLDRRNFRTVPQASDEDAIRSMISIAPDRFWALCESLIESGYLPTENIIILKTREGKLIVKEGNRRVAAMKLILGYLELEEFDVPSSIKKKIESIDNKWKIYNSAVPCAIYPPAQKDLVDRIVSLAHGKGEKAGKDNWTSVARARHNRDKNKGSEPGLDLLEKYLEKSRNLTPVERELWSGNYNLAVLDAAIRPLLSRVGVKSSQELADQYPAVNFKKEIDDILRDIGYDRLGFPRIRSTVEDFGVSYGIPQKPSTEGKKLRVVKQRSGRSVAANDPKSVIKTLKDFIPKGRNRSKLVLVLAEARSLKIEKHPHAFCFLLRAMFELSAKAYCIDHAKDGLKINDNNGKEKRLVDVLIDVKKHITKGKDPKDPLCKSLHGAMTELQKKDGLLSVTSMNQLIHNPNFVIDDSHISIVFTNIFPLLFEMNK